MATATIYASAGDGEIRHGSNSSWATMRNDSSGTTSDHTSTQAFGCYSGNNAGDATTFAAARGYLPFDLSSIPSGATITAIDLVIKPYAEWHGAAGSMCVCSSSQASLTALATSDWGNAGTTEYVTSRPAFSSFTAGTYKTLALNAAGIAAATVGAGGQLLICLRSSYDLDNSAPTAFTFGGVGLDFSERSGTGDDPYIVVTYTPANTPVSGSETVSVSDAAAITSVISSAVGFCDTLAGTDGTNLESHTPTGPYGDVAASGSWSQWYPTSGFARLRLTSNKLYSYTSAAIPTTSEYRHSQQILDGEYSADVSIPGAHNDGGYVVMSLRHAGAAPGSGSGYQLYFSNGSYVTAGTLRLDATVGGSSTALGNHTIGTLIPGTTYRVTLVVDGDQISVKLNGTTVLGPFTDTSVTARGYVHLGIATPNGASTSVGLHVDNVVVLPLDAPSPETASVSDAASAPTDPTYVSASSSDSATVAESAAPVLVAPRPTAGTHETRSVYGSPTTLFPSNGAVGTHGAHYGLPDGITLPDGTKFVVARKSTAHSAPWDGTFVAKTMAPGGSWSAEATILDTSYDERDPSVGLLADGTLCLTWNRLDLDGNPYNGDNGDTKFYAPFSTCAPGLDPLVAANWSTPVHITGSGLANNWRVGTDILELTPGGRIVVALYGTPTYPPWADNQCWIGYTDDGGTTWGMLSLLDNGNAHALSSSGEPQLALCSDGSVLAVYRTIASPWETWARRSTDGCATWSSEWRVAQNSINKTGMIRTPDGDHLICFGLNASTLAFSQSWDDGATFATPTDTGLSANLYTQPFSIGAVGVTPNVAVAYAVENGAQNIASVYYVELTRGAAVGASLADGASVNETASAVVGGSSGTPTTSDAFAVTDSSDGLYAVFTAGGSDTVTLADAAARASVDMATASDAVVFTEPLVQAFEVETSSFTIHPQGMVPGTAIGAYLRWEWKGPVAAKLNAGPGAVVYETTVTDDLTATFAGLDPGEYVAYSPAYPTRRLFFMVTE